MINITSKHAKYILPILLILLFAGTASALPVATHGTVQGEMYVSSTANWPSKYTTNNFEVPNGTVVFARYYVGVWGSSGTPTSISTKFNGHEFETKPSYYSTEMGVTWIPYDVTDYLLPGEKNTATIDTKYWGDGRQYGSTLIVVLKNESKPQIEYWVAEGCDWLHYGDYVGSEVDNSFTYFNGTVDIANVQSASLYSTHLTGYNYEDFNGKSLSDPADSTSGEYFNYIRWDNVKSSLVAENQTVNVGRGDDSYCSPVFHALSIVYEKPDLMPVSLTPTTVVPNTSNTMTVSIENQGNKDSTAFNVSLLVDGTVMDTQTVTSLASEGSTNVDFHWTPNGTKDSYTLTANLDPENAVNEEDETNNSLTSLVGTTTAKTPIADFTAKPTSGDAPLTVEFTDTSANTPISWAWDFGDGTTSNEQNPKHTYNIPESYNVTLTVTNANGNDSRIKTNYIVINSLVADFTATPLSGGAPLTVTFTDQSTGTPTSWAWDFGGGATSTENNPTHIYSTPGTYTVNLTITNIGGTNSTVKTGYITVSTITPVANFTATRTTGSSPLTVQFMDQSKNVPAEWLWDFGDGITSTEQNPTHTYTTIGTYTVKLTATNIAGNNTTTKTGYITVSGVGPVWKAKSEWDVPYIDKWAAPCLADLDGDGDYDLMMGSYKGLIYGYENRGTKNNPVWTTKTEWNVLDSLESCSRPCLTDLDGDGDYDLLIGVYKSINAYENTGTKNNPVWTRKPVWDVSGITSYNYAQCSADLDGDGDYDLLIGTFNGITYAYENTGTANSPVWTIETEWNAPDIGSYAVPCLADLDGDGDYDLLIGEKTSSIYGYENTGTATSPLWTKKSEWDASIIGKYMRPCVADLDSDGDYDLLIGVLTGLTYGYENTASSTMAKPDLTLTSVTPQSSIVVNTLCTISSTINNTDTENVDAFNATLSVNGTVVDTQPVSEIASGSSSTVNFTWTPTVAGDYNLTVTADPENGISESDETNNALTVLVTASSGSTVPVANFTADVTNGTAPLTVNFTDQSTGSPTSWLWDFGDGTNATEQNVSHTYTSAGNYTVNLTVANAGGSDSEVKTEYIIVSKSLPEAPVANFAANQTSGTAPFDVQFTDASTGIVSSYAWDFDNDGTVDSSEQNPVYTYVTAGNYTVNLTVTNEAGSNSTVKTNYIAVSSAETNDLTIGSVNTVPGSAVFAREANTVKITNIKNTGTATLTNISLALYASDVSDGTVPVNTTTIDSLANGGTVTVSLIDPTIRSLEGGTVTYTAVVDPDNLIPETNEANNNKSGSAKSVKYNGYKGKGIYWEGGSNITTKHTYDLQGNLLYSTQPVSAYKGVGWTDRTETWTSSDLPIPSDSTVEKVLLYLSYNWDTTSGGVPKWTATFNDNSLTNGTLYTDKSNFGSYGNYIYGLYVFDVTNQFKTSGNSLVMTPDTGNSNALYPSTLVVIYRNSNETRKQIFINDECDELAYSASSYGTTLEEATAYAPFTGMSVNVSKVANATLHSFAGSAGPNEGNLLFNGNTMATNAWQGTSSTSSALVSDVKNYINETGNEASIQGSSSGGMDALQQILVVEYQKEQEAASVANFTANVTTGTTPLEVQFTDASTGNVSSYAWDFDNDGTVDSTKQNPVHTYAAAGNYTVNLTVANAGGSDYEIKTGYVVVSEPLPGAPVADFAANQTSGTAPFDVQFTDASTGTVSSYSWDFNNDGTVDSTEQNPIYTYTVAGTYTVNLTVTGSEGSDSEVKTGYINVISLSPAKPVANFSANPTEGKAPLKVAFTDTSTGSPTTRYWTFGDGTTSTKQNLTHKYSKAGKYTVKLSVRNAAGRNTVTKTDYINVIEKNVTEKPVANFTSNVTSGTAPLTVTFTDTSTGTLSAWNWDFGDGTNATEQNPVHTYSKVGKYTVSLTVENGAGSNSTTKSSYINVVTLKVPVAAFSAKPTSGKAPLTVTFTDKSTGGPASWKWNFGDGNTSTEQNPVYTYSKLGKYTVKLTVKNAKGSNTVSKSKYITVVTPLKPPNAAFSASPTSGKAPLTVNFTDKSTNSPASWKWTFGDGTSSTEQNPVHTYSKVGKYTVKLKVKNSAGSSTTSKSSYIKVKNPFIAPTAAFSAKPTSGKAPLTVTFTDKSKNSPTSWTWTFGDGTSSTEQNPVHTYSKAGKYNVKLKVKNPAGSSTKTLSKYIVVSKK